jgi:hypothetical protein
VFPNRTFFSLGSPGIDPGAASFYNASGFSFEGMPRNRHGKSVLEKKWLPQVHLGESLHEACLRENRTKVSRIACWRHSHFLPRGSGVVKIIDEELPAGLRSVVVNAREVTSQRLSRLEDFSEPFALAD